jgi:predicted SnoaL-like aldol condensation-catalyzing enzyme
MKSIFRVGLAVGLLLTGYACYAQTPVTGVADPDSLFHDKNPKLDKNKQAAYHIMKELLEANHWDMADKWLTERYIQHNPQAANGREAVVKFFTQVMKRQPTPIPEKFVKTKIVAVLADGDYVTVVTPREYKDSKGQPYTSTWFDMWRFVNGKADEHWDNALKP